jgi:hypothetical protein
MEMAAVAVVLVRQVVMEQRLHHTEVAPVV